MTAAIYVVLILILMDTRLFNRIPMWYKRRYVQHWSTLLPGGGVYLWFKYLRFRRMQR